MKRAYRLGIPALALGRGLAEAGFVLAVKAGLSGRGPAVLAALIPLLVIARFLFQDRGAVLEAAALRAGVAAWRRRVLDALRLRAVPAWRPANRRALGRALDEDIPLAAEGALARRRFWGACLEGVVLVPLLFALAWKAALVGLAAAALLWPVLRLRNRRLKTLEREGAAGREGALHAREDFAHALEALPAAGFANALTRLDHTLEEAYAPTWRWRRAQARYPAILETALFFVLCAILFAGALTLQGFESVLLFALLLLLAYRPLREAARQYPVAAAGDRAARDLTALVNTWNALPPRAFPAPHRDPHTLAVEHVSFAYEPGTAILNDVTLTFDARQVTGLTGPNGAGKTTLLRLLCGAETPQTGRILWPAAALHDHAARGLAVMPQRAWPGHDWPAWAATYKAARPEDWKALDDLLGLERLTVRAAHPETLSGGERQRMTLARTLASDAAYLVLDEPTTALPADERERVLRGALAFWKTRGSRMGGESGEREADEAAETRGALVVSHEPFLANLCDTVLRLEGIPS